MLRSAALTAVLLASCGLAQAQPGCTAIHLAPGASSPTLTGIARATPPFACFTLEAAPNETAHVTLLHANPGTAFSIQGIAKDQYQYSFKTSAQPYRIDVYTIDGNSKPQNFALVATFR